MRYTECFCTCHQSRRYFLICSDSLNTTQCLRHTRLTTHSKPKLPANCLTAMTGTAALCFVGRLASLPHLPPLSPPIRLVQEDHHRVTDYYEPTSALRIPPGITIDQYLHTATSREKSSQRYRHGSHSLGQLEGKLYYDTCPRWSLSVTG
jgi:hypothetical protein